MNWISRIILGALLVAAAAACSNSGNKAADPEAYALGEAHAQRLIDAEPDTAAMSSCLLDVRTRETDLRHRLGDAAADSYIEGFESYVRANDPSLPAPSSNRTC